ncbi:Homeodomain-like [Penicillium roqueforti FM164]|uniref:Homeodomain-like n=1 Tax=Penicillium roqueforti (strain FM164) TaxID=1365484 RepID=W6QQ31_PENRF|nr:Homeodomain-like [Penicillium roqueforti FM164]
MTASVPEQPRSRGIQWPSINDYTRTINVPNLPQRQSVQPLDISSTAGEPERPQSRGIKWPSVNKIPRTIDMQKRPRRHSVRQPSSGDLPITDEEPEQHQGRRLPWEPIYDTSRKTKTPSERSTTREQSSTTQVPDETTSRQIPRTSISGGSSPTTTVLDQPRSRSLPWKSSGSTSKKRKAPSEMSTTREQSSATQVLDETPTVLDQPRPRSLPWKSKGSTLPPERRSLLSESSSSISRKTKTLSERSTAREQSSATQVPDETPSRQIPRTSMSGGGSPTTTVLDQPRSQSLPWKSSGSTSKKRKAPSEMSAIRDNSQTTQVLDQTQSTSSSLRWTSAEGTSRESMGPPARLHTQSRRDLRASATTGSRPNQQTRQVDRGHGQGADTIWNIEYTSDLDFSSRHTPQRARTSRDFSYIQRQQPSNKGDDESIWGMSSAIPSSPPPTRGNSQYRQQSLPDSEILGEEEVFHSIEEHPLRGRYSGPRDTQQGTGRDTSRSESCDPSHFAGTVIREVAYGSRHGPSFAEEREVYEEKRIQELLELGREQQHGPSRMQSHGPSRMKVRWEEAETARLIRLWMKFPMRWAYIKQLDDESEDPQLEMRTPVDCKDRMRNIKKWALKNRKTLPPEFALITLGEKDLVGIAKALAKVTG